MQFLRHSFAVPPRFSTTFKTPAKYLLAGLALGLGACASQAPEPVPPPPPVDSVSQVLFRNEVARIETKAAPYLSAMPVSVTAFSDEQRSASALEDFPLYGDESVGDDSATARREALFRFSDVVATLTSAYLVSGNQQYADAAVEHLRTWFMEPDTRVNPVLLYTRPSENPKTSRDISIADTLHLTEVARSVKVLTAYGTLSPDEDHAIKGWFSDYLAWMKTSQPDVGGEVPDIRSVYWSVQAAAFADLVDDATLLDDVRENFKNRFIGRLMATNGSFPSQHQQGSPYGDSLLMLDALATLAQVASTPEDNLWRYKTDDGRGMAKAMRYMMPYMLDKNRWPLQPDAQNWDQWPVRQPSLAFAALAYNNKDYLQVWQPLQPDPKQYNVLRNLPVRHPLLWLAHNMPKAAELEEVAPEEPTEPTKVASRS